MPGMIYIPRQRTTWDQLFPLVMQMIYRKKMAEEQARREKELLKQREQFALTEAEKQRQFQGNLANKKLQAQLMAAGYRPVEPDTGQKPVFEAAGKGWIPSEVKIGKLEPIELGGKVIGAGIPVLRNGQVIDYKFQTVPPIKLNTKDFTDERGNVTRIISESTTGKIVKEIPLGKIGKGAISKQPSKPQIQKVYNLFKQQNPNYKGTILDFNKAWKAKDPDEVALGLAAKDWRVLGGKVGLADAALEYRKAWTQLKGQTTSKGKLTDPNIARQYLEKAGGDKEKARELAREDGWSF